MEFDSRDSDMNPKVVIITPLKNEAKRIPIIANQLEIVNRNFPIVWIVVDDSSVDNTLEAVANLNGFRPEILLSTQTSGKLILGGAFKAWFVGVNYALQHFDDFTHLMKLDADVELEEFYFNKLEVHLKNPAIGLIGGVLQNSNREQQIHVPGPVKLYSKAGLESLSTLPLETGYDVMDEILLKDQGFKVKVVPEAKFTINRAIGASQGLIHGRRRNGLVCRWTGYYQPYFALHLLRYLFRKPYLIGSFAMLFGYLRAPRSPYSSDLRALHAKSQRELLLKIFKNPIRELSSLYGRSKH